MQVNARSLQPRRQAVARGAQHGRDVAICFLHGVHRDLQLIHRAAQLARDVVARRRGLLGHAQRAHQLAAQAVVQVAHQALALFGGAEQLFLGALALKGGAQFGVARAQLLAQVVIGRARGGAFLAQPLGNDPGQ